MTEASAPKIQNAIHDRKFLLTNFEYQKRLISKERSRERKISCPNCGYNNYIKYTSEDFVCVHCKERIVMNRIVLSTAPQVKPVEIRNDENGNLAVTEKENNSPSQENLKEEK